MNTIPLRIQDLPPHLAHFLLNIEQTMLRYVDSFQKTTLFVACSGGADSLALLFIVYYLQKRLGYSLHALHCNHMLRPEAREDELYVKRICNLLGIPYTVRRIDVASYKEEHSLGLEEAGRLCRYTFFYEVMDRYQGSTLLCTGHHANDLAEDVLMRLLRGTSLDMLCAMPAFSKERRLLRPLLQISKTELTDFLQSIHVTWQEDMTNFETTYLRSRIRMEILPHLMKENPSLLESISNLHMQAEWDIDYWDTILSHYNPLKTSYIDLISLHKAGRMRLYRKACTTLGTQPTFDTLLAIDSAVLMKKSKQFMLSNNV
nr:tRNA lysidine(34) synthetase TilS [Desulfovibrionaceae bacterium]